MNSSMNFLQNEMSRIYDNLQHQKSMGAEAEFDIKVDDMIAVPRTSEIENFEKYKPMLHETSLNIQVRVYRGKSRTYNLYKFKTPYGVQSSSAQEQLQANDKLKMDLLNTVSIGRFTDYKYKEAKKKIKRQKQLIESLKSELEELKEKGHGNSLLETVSGTLAPLLSGKGVKESVLSGIEDKTILDVIELLQKNLSSDDLQTVLGINVALASNKNLITPIHDYIKKYSTKE